MTQLVQRGENVIWAHGSGARLLPVMPYLKSDLALGVLLHSRSIASEDALVSSPEKGTFHRVFRNKSFKLPSWKRTANIETQTQSFEEQVWKPEQTFMGVNEFRVPELNPAIIEDELRAQLENNPKIKKVTNAPILELEVFDHGGKIQFANGFITEFKQFYFCDSITELKQLPKLTPVFKHQLGNVKSGHQVSALQVVFHHSVALKQTFDTGLVIPLNRDSGETFDRDVMGYFLDPMRSVWTVFLQSEEVEENHEIMKKLRKMKQALNRAFESPEFLPDGKKEFMATVEKEQVRLENSFVITHGHFKESKSNEDFVLLNDAFGLTDTLEKIAHRFQMEPAQFEITAQPEMAQDLQ